MRSIVTCSIRPHMIHIVLNKCAGYVAHRKAVSKTKHYYRGCYKPSLRRYPMMLPWPFRCAADIRRLERTMHHVQMMHILIPNSKISIQPPLSPNSLAQSSYSFKPCLLTDGRMVCRLALKSSNRIGRISSMVMCNSFSPKLRSGPIAASLARAVMSEPENPIQC